MAFFWGIVLLILPIDASKPCQHEECQVDRSVLLQHAVKKHEHNASGDYGWSRLGNHGCSNYASSELKKTWTEFETYVYESDSCMLQCGQTAGCVGFAWLTTSDTTCKGSSQKKGSCTLWKEACSPDYSSSCQAWVQYAAPSSAPAPPPAPACTLSGQDMWATGTKRNCCPNPYGPEIKECLVDGKYMCMEYQCPPAPSPPAHHGNYYDYEACCNWCHSFCSPNSGSCYDTMAKDYYLWCGGH